MTKQDRKEFAAVLARAIKQAGGPVELAKFISKRYGKITPQAIWLWEVCPWNRVGQVCAAVQAKGGKLEPRELRPDVFEAMAA